MPSVIRHWHPMPAPLPPALQATLPPLGRAALAGSAARVQQLLAAGADPNEATAEGVTALHAAMGLGRQAVVAALLGAGADPNYRAAIDGSTLLHYAARENHPEAVQQLVAAGANLDARLADGSTPLKLCAEHGAWEAAAALLAAGAGEAPQPGPPGCVAEFADLQLELFQAGQTACNVGLFAAAVRLLAPAQP